MPALTAAQLAGLLACDTAHAVSDVRPASRVDGAAGAFVGVQGRRAAGAAPGGRGAPAAEPQTTAELGRPGDTRRPGPAAATAAADEPAGDTGHAAALAPVAGSPEVDLPAPGRTAASRCPGRGEIG